MPQQQAETLTRSPAERLVDLGDRLISTDAEIHLKAGTELLRRIERKPGAYAAIPTDPFGSLTNEDLLELYRSSRIQPGGILRLAEYASLVSSQDGENGIESDIPGGNPYSLESIAATAAAED